MALLKIVTEEDPVLRKKAKEIDKITKRLRELAKDMLDTMYQAKGVGLAAPQVGISERLIVIDIGEGPIVLANPSVIESSGEIRDIEGCLSIPGRTEYITRAEKAIVTGMNLDGKKVRIESAELLSRAFQHEIDHLNGILFIDHLPKEK